MTSVTNIQTPRARWYFLLVMLAVVPVVVVAALIGATKSTFMRKLLMAAVQVTSISWFAMWFCVALAAIRRQRLLAILLTLLAVGYGIAGNGLFSRFFMGRLERDYYSFDAAKLEPLDVLIVLGGGVSTRRNGFAQANASGERIVLAARLYHTGKARRLITSGDPIPEIGIIASGSDATLRIWNDLGIPNEHVILSRGTSTSEELKFVRDYLDRTDGDRVGLLTSAWHLPRALRQAEKNGLKVVPVPSDFWTDYPPGPILFDFIPSSEAFLMTHRAMLEYIGRFVGR